MKIHVTDRDGAEHVVEGQDGDALMIRCRVLIWLMQLAVVHVHARHAMFC